MMKNIFYYQTDIGQIGIAEENGHITHVTFESDSRPEGYSVCETDLLQNAADQLREYLSGKRKCFDLPMCPSGTPFMQKVWGCLENIPYGQTRSYSDIAEAAGNRKACRAVGLANNRNPVPIFIPCHRVIGAKGSLTGYRGGLEMKRILLELERKAGGTV
jgi:methylated-DNA-[protein]-cysteine S-methyltransferase